MEPKLQKTSRWHIDKGVVGKHHGLSYCEGCDYVPPHKTIFNSIYLEYERGPQILSQYCPRCGSYMINVNKDWED